MARMHGADTAHEYIVFQICHSGALPPLMLSCWHSILLFELPSWSDQNQEKTQDDHRLCRRPTPAPFHTTPGPLCSVRESGICSSRSVGLVCVFDSLFSKRVASPQSELHPFMMLDYSTQGMFPILLRVPSGNLT